MPGERGPVGKRVDQRLGHQSKAARQAVTRAPGAEVVEVPEGDPDWHPIAARWYAALGQSGQSQFYESSDWLTAYAVAESMSREFHPQPMVIGKGADAHLEMVLLPPKAASLTAWLKAGSGLLVLEGDRRRVALELTRPEPEVEGVSHLDELARRRQQA